MKYVFEEKDEKGGVKPTHQSSLFDYENVIYDEGVE